MKKLMTLALAAGMLLGAATGAGAIDFKAKGQWLMGFSAGDGSLVSHTRKAGETSRKANDTNDIFSAAQRLRLQLDAVASESLSGTVYFEIGDTTWGQNVSGGALGADQKIVELKNAYIDWMVPNTDLKSAWVSRVSSCPTWPVVPRSWMTMWPVSWPATSSTKTLV